MGTALTRFYERLPEPVRFGIELGRVAGGLQGLWWVATLVTWLIVDSAIWATLQAWPWESKVALMGAAALVIVWVFGLLGAWQKARTGAVRFMSDFDLATAAGDLSEEVVAARQGLDEGERIVWTTEDVDWAVREERMASERANLRFNAKVLPRIAAIVKEAKRRNAMSEEWRPTADTYDEIADALADIAVQLTIRSGRVR